MAEDKAVYVCAGKRCSAKPKRRRKLVSALEEVAAVTDCGCVKICRGPVVGVPVDGELEWFRQMYGDKPVRRLRKLVKRGKLGKALKQQQVAKRRGNEPPRPKK